MEGRVIGELASPSSFELVVIPSALGTPTTFSDLLETKSPDPSAVHGMDLRGT